MSLEHIRHCLSQVARHLVEHPHDALSHDKPAVAVLESGLRCRRKQREIANRGRQPHLSGGPMSPTAKPESLSQHLRELEESLLQPDVRKSTQLMALLADEFVEFGTSGRIYTKEDLVAVLQAESPSIQTTGNFKASLLAPNVALLTYFIRHEASPPGYTLRSSVWQLRGEQWQMVFHQSTRTSVEQLPS